MDIEEIESIEAEEQLKSFEPYNSEYMNTYSGRMMNSKRAIYLHLTGGIDLAIEIVETLLEKASTHLEFMCYAAVANRIGYNNMAVRFAAKHFKTTPEEILEMPAKYAYKLTEETKEYPGISDLLFRLDRQKPELRARVLTMKPPKHRDGNGAAALLHDFRAPRMRANKEVLGEKA